MEKFSECSLEEVCRNAGVKVNVIAENLQEAMSCGCKS